MKNLSFRPGMLIFSVLIPLCIGGLSALVTKNTMKTYLSMNKPPLSPPGWMFPVVWTILYVMMGVAAYFVITSGADSSLIRKAMMLYAAQLIFNFFWSILFFKLSLYLFAFIELMAMWAIIIVCTVFFFLASRTAGLLMLPYLLWSTFAAYLNFAVYRLSVTPAAA